LNCTTCIQISPFEVTGGNNTFIDLLLGQLFGGGGGGSKPPDDFEDKEDDIGLEGETCQ
jgi:hypothetical protein